MPGPHRWVKVPLEHEKPGLPCGLVWLNKEPLREIACLVLSPPGALLVQVMCTRVLWI